MSLNYTKKTIENFLHPQNIGQVKDPDAIASVGNMVCGDQLEFSLKVKNGRIADVAFLSFGCASNIATASVLTEKVKGLTLEEAKKYPWQKVVAELGGLPDQKVHCSVLAVEGLKKVIAEYEKKHPAVKKAAVKKAAIRKKAKTSKPARK
jgi:nitrogen fixation NifU-like protein